MSIVNVPIVDSTLVNPRLLDLRVKFIKNDVELLRRKFEVWGVELSQEVLDLYVKSLIIYNANVVWDLKPVVYTAEWFRSYTNGTTRLEKHTDAYYTKSFSIPVGIKSIDPITLSFLSFEEASTLIKDHVNAAKNFPYSNDWKVQLAPNVIIDLGPLNSMGMEDVISHFESKVGKLDRSYLTQQPTTNHYYISSMENVYQLMAGHERQSVKSMFQNPTLGMKSLMPVLEDLFSIGEDLKLEIPYKAKYDYEKIHLSMLPEYFSPLGGSGYKRLTNYSTEATSRLQRNIMLGKIAPKLSAGYDEMINSISPEENQEWMNRINSAYNPTVDTRTDYQKVFTNTAPSLINIDRIEQSYSQIAVYKEYVSHCGGFKSVMKTLLFVLCEAHASVRTPINLFHPQSEFKNYFDKYLYIPSTGGRFRFYVFLNDNYRVTYNSRNYVISGPTTLSGGGVMIPVDASKPFPYYHVENLYNTTRSHIVAPYTLLGLQKLRNGFLFQDVSKNFESTFVNFPQSSIEYLEYLVTKQVSLYDLLDDVRTGNIFEKTITEQVPVQPFNPMMPQYTTKTATIDMMKTEQGDLPIIHPEEEYVVRWKRIYAEFVLMSAFYHEAFINSIKPTIDEYNNKVGTYILGLLTEMNNISKEYSEEELERLQKEKEKTELETKLLKLKTGVYIDDKGREYWRPLTPEEQAEVNKMITRVETNLATIEKNKEIEAQNAILQQQADEQRIRENELRQAQVDAEAIKMNETYQKMANAEWKKKNITDLVAPSLEDIASYSDQTGLTLTESLVAWMNENPYFVYNIPLAQKVEEMRLQIKKAEEDAATLILNAKANEIEITKALKELFTIQN